MEMWKLFPLSITQISAVTGVTLVHLSVGFPSLLDRFALMWKLFPLPFTQISAATGVTLVHLSVGFP